MTTAKLRVGTLRSPCIQNRNQPRPSAIKVSRHRIIARAESNNTGNSAGQPEANATSSAEDAAHSHSHDMEQSAAHAATGLTKKKGQLSGVLPFDLAELNRKTKAREAARTKLRERPTLFSEAEVSIDF